MADQSTSKASGFVWYDVMTTDTTAAKTFYKNVMGWSMADASPPGRTYIVASTGPTMVSGIMPIPEDAVKMGVTPAWMGYIGVADVDAMATRVKAAGGFIHRGPEDIPNVGRFAVAADPHGAGFMLFEAKSSPQIAPVAPHTPGHVGWRELNAGSGAEAFAFYSGLFGWTKADAIDMGPMGTYQIFAVDGIQVGGIMTKNPALPAAYWFYVFNVDAVDAAAERVVQAGGRIVMAAHEVPGGQWVVRCTDPQGAAFGLVAFKR